VLDVTNPAAQTWWRDKVAAFMAAYDLDGIKLDRGEEHLPETATPWANGRPGRENRNAYPTIQAKIHYDALLAAHPDHDFVLFTRAGYTGTAQWSTVWGGDIPGSTNFGSGPGTYLGLRSAIISQQRAAFIDNRLGLGHRRLPVRDRKVFTRWPKFTFPG
jgi:alpha-D-xyloside xylohydrolase